MNINPIVIDAIIGTMSYTEKDLKPDFRAIISKCNENGLHQSVWAHRGDMISDQLADNDDLVVLHIRRGNLWQFEAIYDCKSKALYIMISEKNLQANKEKVLKNGASSHYLYSLLHYNQQFDKSTEQLELISDSDQFEKNEKRRISDCNRMLADYADKVDNVIVVSFAYAESMVAGGRIELFDSKYNEIESRDISNEVLKAGKTSESMALGVVEKTSAKDDEPLVKLKNIIK